VPGLTLHTNAFVLLKRPPGDSFQTCNVFSAEHGLLLVLQRIAKKTGTAKLTPLDLFDEAALILESSNQGQTWFVKESQLLQRATGIGRSYDALRHASGFASMVCRNHVPEESRANVTELLRHALGAFNIADRPDIVHFKAVYCFARDEGYPIKEHWLPTLPAEDRSTVATLLSQPVAGQTAATDDVARLHGRLTEYLRGHSEFIFD
jgi:hypothetical protein